MLELNEITSYIMLSRVSVSSNLAESSGLPHLARNFDLSTAVSIDECLTKLEKRLPPAVSFNFVQDDAANDSNNLRILFRLRYVKANRL